MKQEYILIPAHHGKNYYPNDLKQYLEGKKLTLLFEYGLSNLSSIMLRDYSKYAEQYTKLKEAGEINIAAKEDLWLTKSGKSHPKSVRRPIHNSFIGEYIEGTMEILPKSLSPERLKLMRRAEGLASTARDIILIEIGIDYGKEFSLVGADFRCDKDDKGWDTKVDISKADEDSKKQIREFFQENNLFKTEFKTEIGIGAGLKTVMGTYPSTEVFYGSYGMIHYPTVSTFARAAGCNVKTKAYCKLAEIYVDDWNRFGRRKLRKAYMNIAENAKIAEVEYSPDHKMLEDVIFTGDLLGILSEEEVEEVKNAK